MSVLWDANPRTSLEIVEALKQHPKTVKTYITRLLKKGAIRAERAGRAYLYSPAFSQEECQKTECENFLQKVFSGSLPPMLAQLVDDKKLTDKEIDELRAILKKRGTK